MNHDDLFLEAARQYASMGDKVAGFAISSQLLVTFACLKDLTSWAKDNWRTFAVGILGGAVVYVLTVVELCRLEIGMRANVPGVPAELVSSAWVLAAARSAGILVFAVVAMLAVLAARSNKPLPGGR